ncbi:MAG: YetF domain-containing protein [Pacificimonas sp.]
MFVADPTLDLVLRGLLLTAIGMVWVVLLVRVVGLRAFSKMTNFDFVMTVATGSLLAGAGQATNWSSFAQVMVAMTALFLVQYLTARLRKTSDSVEDVMQNDPILLMRHGEINHDALQKTRVAESDLIAKLREANAIDMSKVHAVVLETTGDVSVLHGDDDLDDRLIQNIRGFDDSSGPSGKGAAS